MGANDRLIPHIFAILSGSYSIYASLHLSELGLVHLDAGRLQCHSHTTWGPTSYLRQVPDWVTPCPDACV